MSNRKGFTLIEIIVVLVIIAVLAGIALPNYFTTLQQGAAKSAQNNLITIYNAEKNYYLSAAGNGSYCIAGCNTLANINTNLSLNITDTNFTNYTCAGDPSGFSCTATDPSIAGVSLTITNNPLILPGGTGSLNPSCNPSTSTYCPS